MDGEFGSDYSRFIYKIKLKHISIDGNNHQCILPFVPNLLHGRPRAFVLPKHPTAVFFRLRNRHFLEFEQCLLQGGTDLQLENLNISVLFAKLPNSGRYDCCFLDSIGSDFLIDYSHPVHVG